MENNIERLTIKEIAPYLPYGLKIQDSLGDIHTLNYLGENTLNIEGRGFQYGAYADIENVKPLLFNISCLTKTIQHGNESFIPLVKFAEICWDGLSGYELHHTRLEIITRFSSMMYENAQYKTLTFREGSFCFSVLDSELKIIGHFTVSNQYQLFQKLAEWHINFVGIPEGLYIDKNTLK